MNKHVKRLGRRAVQRSRALRSVYVWWRFSEERKLYGGQFDETTVSPSLVHFSVHKSASVFLNRVLRTIAEYGKLRFIDLPNYFDMNGSLSLSRRLEDVREKDKLRLLFRPNGYLYASIRNPSVLDLIIDPERYRYLLTLRDPRDVVISAYYSFGFTHEEPVDPTQRERFLSRRRTIAQQTVDEYVHSNLEYWLGKYRLYCDALMDRNNVLYLKTEELTGDMAPALRKIIAFAGIAIPERVSDSIAARQTQSNAKLGSRRAQVTPATWRWMNEQAGPLLERLGYE